MGQPLCVPLPPLVSIDRPGGDCALALFVEGLVVRAEPAGAGMPRQVYWSDFGEMIYCDPLSLQLAKTLRHKLVDGAEICCWMLGLSVGDVMRGEWGGGRCWTQVHERWWKAHGSSGEHVRDDQSKPWQSH
jgi:hypothetical protein